MGYLPETKKGLFSFAMLLVFFGLMLLCLYLSLLVVQYTLPIFFGITDSAAFVNSTNEQLKNPLALIYLQALSSSIGFFLLPVIIYHLSFRSDMATDMGMRILPSARYWLLAVSIMLLAGVFIQWLVQINTAIPLSGQWQVLRSGQELTEKIIGAFFSDAGLPRFLLLTVVMAILPAVAEEFCFRGTIQNALSQTTLGRGGAIIISGLIFSLAHFEFNNLLAIWCMGIVLGCLYYYSGSIWVSVAAHFFNNFMVVVGKFAFLHGWVHTDIADTDTLPIYITLPAGALMIYGLIVLRKWHRQKPSMLY